MLLAKLLFSSLQNLQLITVSACCSNCLMVFQIMFIIYTSLTLLLLFILTLLVANIQRIEFRREGLGSHRAVALAILPLPALYIAWAILLVYFPVLRYHALLWIEFALTGVLPMLIMIVLFAPNVSTLRVTSFSIKASKPWNKAILMIS